MNYIICYGMFSIYNIIVYLADYIMYDKRIKGYVQINAGIFVLE